MWRHQMVLGASQKYWKTIFLRLPTYIFGTHNSRATHFNTSCPRNLNDVVQPAGHGQYPRDKPFMLRFSSNQREWKGKRESRFFPVQTTAQQPAHYGGWKMALFAYTCHFFSRFSTPLSSFAHWQDRPLIYSFKSFTLGHGGGGRLRVVTHNYYNTTQNNITINKRF